MENNTTLKLSRQMIILILWMGYLIIGIQIMKLESERQALGFVALGAIIISTIVFKFLTSHHLKMIVICVWVTGMAFLMGYLLTTIILEGS